MFAASLASAEDDTSDVSAKESKPFTDIDADDERDISECIICSCGVQDSDFPLCFLGHVQRSRVLVLAK